MTATSSELIDRMVIQATNTIRALVDLGWSVEDATDYMRTRSTLGAKPWLRVLNGVGHPEA